MDFSALKPEEAGAYGGEDMEYRKERLRRRHSLNASICLMILACMISGAAASIRVQAGSAGSGWIPDVLVYGDSSNAEINPSIASSGSTLWMAYEHYDPSSTHYGLYLSKSTNGGSTWSYVTGWVYASNDVVGRPSIAVDSVGDVLIAAEVSGSGGGIVVFMYMASTGWGYHQITVSSSDHSPVLCFDLYDQAHLAYEHSDGWGGYDIDYTHAYSPFDTWSSITAIVGGSILDFSVNRHPAISYQSNGYLYAAYERGSAGSRDIYVMRSTDWGSTWSAEPGTCVSSTSVDEFGCSIAAPHYTSTVVVAWTYIFSGSDYDVYYAYSTNSGSSYAYRGLATSTSMEQAPVLEENSGKDASIRIAFWKSNDIWYSVATTSSPTSWSSLVQVTDTSAYASSSYVYPTITAYLHGTGHKAGIAWTDYRGASYDIYYTTQQAVEVTGTASPTSGTPPLSVSFTCTASYGIPPYTYSWNFGDGWTSTQQNPSHSFNSEGTYYPSVTVTDSIGDQATWYGPTINVAWPPLIVTGTAFPTSGTAPLTVYFTCTPSGGTGSYTSYSWAFGDGGTSTSQSPSHTYNTVGSFSATVIVTDSAFHTVQWTSPTITVSWPPLIVTGTAFPTSGTAPLTVSFTSSASGGTGSYTSYSWDFRDGGTSTQQNPSHTYSTAGTYIARVTVTDSAFNTGQWSSPSIVVSWPPVVVAGTASPTSGNVPLTVLFTSSASGGSGSYASYSWNFGDSGTGTGQNPSHTYTMAGTYTATVTVTDTASNTGQWTSPTITVSWPPLTVTGTASPTTGVEPLPVSFTCTPSGGTGSYTSYSWNFGDGGTSTSQNPTHTYSSGTYTATVTVTDSASHTAQWSSTSIVVTGVLTLSGTSASPTTGIVPLSVSFTCTASGGTGPYTYSWNFGDGGTSTDRSPTHTYNAAGTYTATVTVTDSASHTAGWTSPSIRAYAVLSAGGTASPLSGTAPLSVAFTCTPSGGIPPYGYLWSFGDGGTSTSQNPSHTYNIAGSFSATVTVTDSASHTAQWTSSSIAVTGVVSVTASASPTSGAAPLSVSFACTASGGTAPYTYSWNFGDGGTSTSQNPSHTFNAAGTYNATVTVTDSASHSTQGVCAPITVAGAITIAASGSASPASGSAPLSVSFTCTPTGGTGPYTYSWDFGDGGTSTSQNPSHTYTSAGTYNVKVTVTDSASHTGNWTTSITVSSPSGGGRVSSTSGLFMGLSAVIVIAALLILFFLLRRRKKGDESAGTPPPQMPSQ